MSTGIAATASHGCDAVLSRWCNSNCPHYAEFGPLVALFDRQHVATAPSEWRCYARITLDINATKYLDGRAYCTRPQLRDVLRQCQEELARERSLEGGDAVAVAVEPRGSAHNIIGREQASSSSMLSSPSESDGDSDDGDTQSGVGDQGRHRIAIVMARCREPTAWLANVHRGLIDGLAESGVVPSLELHVYEKCNDEDSDEARTRLGWQVHRRTYLRNIGEECFAYLHYLRDHYDALPDAAIFFQGDGVLGGRDFLNKASAFGRTLAAHGWRDVWRSVNDHQYIALTGKKAACSQMLKTPNCMEGAPRQFECLQSLNEKHGLAHSSPPRAFAVYANAQFGVTRDRMMRRPLALYEALLGEFDAPQIDSCFAVYGAKGRPGRGTCALLEYLWPTLMGEPPIVDPRWTMSGRVAPGAEHS